jgi:uncharacterized RDD family membrane protein YckC
LVAAGFRRRLTAFVVDAIVILPLAYLILLVVTAIAGASAIVDLADPAAANVRVSAARATLNALVVAAVSAIYFVGSWRRAACTPGQLLLDLRVVRQATGAVEGDPSPAEGDERLSLRHAVLRWALMGAPLGVASALALDAPIAFLLISVASVVWFASLILSTLFTRRGVHDRLSGSQVVRQRDPDA